MDAADQLSTVFPSPGMRVLSNIINVFGVTVTSFCFARRSASVDLLSFSTYRNLSWARACIYLLFIDSWIFLATSWLLINGIGMSRSRVFCGLGIYSCIFAYASSKFLIYLFLGEKVHVVWGKGPAAPRLSSPVYRACVFVLGVYFGIIALLIIGKVAFLKRDGTCVIGLRVYASVPLLTYDLVVNAFLTSLFLWPIFRSHVKNPRLRRVTRRTLAAAVASLATSTVNIAVLTVMDGQQLGWVCLGSCGTDVILNAMVLYWVTASDPAKDGPAPIASSRLPATPAAVAGVAAPTSMDKGSSEQAGAQSIPTELSHMPPCVDPHDVTSTRHVIFPGAEGSGRRQGRGAGIFGSVLGLHRSRARDVEEATCSVQITVTTIVEHDALPDIELDLASQASAVHPTHTMRETLSHSGRPESHW
ncbi:hypothetical protein AURDEDRAFT_186622 [Auricularia subglabra TFB-10046 SS5]|nr:hypothetical protein AURDEDRAFT_186622 [Auricularia subglabra TFB-10046 SS5]